MAEGFARTYGSDVMAPASAGLAPATNLARDTIRAMEEKNIDIRAQFPKTIKQLGKADFDIVVNMSGQFLPPLGSARIVDWEVADPVFMSYGDHCGIRDDIEQRVMKLVLELRRPAQPKFRGQGSGRLEV